MIIECCGKHLDWRSRRDAHCDLDVEQTKCAVCSVSYERRSGYDRYYITRERSRTCSECGGPVHDAHITHPIHVAVMGDSGQSKIELVPCCDKCDRRPNSQGSMIFVEFRPARLAAAS